MSQGRLRLWFRVSPYYAYHATVVGVVLGTAMALADGAPFRGDLMALTLLGALAAHTAAAFANEYFDYVLGADRHVDHGNPFAGGSRVLYLREGLRPEALRRASVAFAGLGVSVGLLLAAWRGLPVLLLGLAGYFFLFEYTGTPLKLAYRGWGEAAVGVSFGPLIVVGAHYVQTGFLSHRALVASVPLGLLIALVLLFNEFPDYTGDAAAGKRNLVVRFGPDRAVGLCGVLMVAFALSLGMPIAFGVLPSAALASLTVVALAAVAFGGLARFRDSPDRLIAANALMLGNVALLGLLLSWGLLR